MEEKTEIPKSRKSYLFKMAAKVALKQGKQILAKSSSHKIQTLLEQADIVVNHVGKLKGAAMKAVQSLSVEGADFLPPEVLKVLETLQSQAEPFPSTVLHQVMAQELGEKLQQLENISEKPIASASIGQVYEATYQDEPVVIKVQYPGVSESVDDDIDTLKKLLKALVVLSQKKVEFDDLMEEARRVLKLETNYHLEEQSLIKYKQLFAESNYIIPKVYTQFTTQKILVLSKEEGLEFPKWLELNPTETQRKKIGEQLLNLYTKEFFENRLVQTDPNPANFLVNSNDQLVLLDFGATVEFSGDFVKDYQLLLRSAFSGDKQQLLNNIFTLNFLSAKESVETQEAFLEFLMSSLSPFDKDKQPFDFSDGEYSSQVRQQALKFSRMLKYSAPPKQLIFLHRKLGGIFMLLKRLGVRADLTPFREKIINTDFY